MSAVVRRTAVTKREKIHTRFLDPGCLTPYLDKFAGNLTEAGYTTIRGDYRWGSGVGSQSWIFFREEVQHEIRDNIPCSKVYEQLRKIGAREHDFEWDKEVTHCWVLQDTITQHIYYAAPMFSEKMGRIPCNSWISVHGSRPSPFITVVSALSLARSLSLSLSLSLARSRSLSLSRWLARSRSLFL